LTVFACALVRTPSPNKSQSRSPILDSKLELQVF